MSGTGCDTRQVKMIYPNGVLITAGNGRTVYEITEELIANRGIKTFSKAGFATGRLLQRTVLLALLFTIGFAQAAFAQNDPPLNFGNNFFVSGDYVVAGAVGINHLVVNNLTTGTITVPDTNPGITGATSVPTGAQIVAAFLYWETVESNSNPGAGQSGFFLPMTIANAFGAAGPPNGGLGYKIQGVNVNPNSNVAWSNGGCPGASTGRVVNVYRADVRS